MTKPGTEATRAARSARAAAGWALTLVLGLPASGAPAAAAGPAPLVKIFVERDGVHRVTDKALRHAGLHVADADVDRLRLRLRGIEVPVRLSRARLPRSAGRFALDFAGRYPRGTKTYEDPYNRASVYLLDLAPAGVTPARYAEDRSPAPEASGARRASRLHVHFEGNRKLMRFSGASVPDETWYWELAMASDHAPKQVPLGIYRVDSSRGFRLRVRLQGYSSLVQDPDHHCDLYWNDQPVGQAVWDGQASYTFEKVLPPELLREGLNRLGFQVKGDNTDGIDVVLLDWVEVEYVQRLDFVRDGQLAFNAEHDAPLELDFGRKARVTVYDAQTARVRALDDKARGLRFNPTPVQETPGDVPRFWAVREGAQLAPAAISVSRSSDLRAQAGADAIFVVHPELLSTAERLAAQRRREGLQVRVVSVDDVYDQFSDGFLAPESIREFLRYAWRHWQPRPRYVLLFGDASWDYKNRTVDDANYPDHEFLPFAWSSVVPKIPSTPLKPDDRRNDRQRVPTFQWQSPWGHAASDNYFALLEGDDDLPDVGVGRIPAGTRAEAEAAVDKILAYAHTPARTRDDALFITDQYTSHQAQTDRLAGEAAQLGYGVTKIYPQPEEKDNAGNSAAIRGAFDAGQALVVFAGHGGRYIWRTGPPDPQKNHDLFTLEHLDELRAAARVPIVISLTCYSAPFDHPTADSIGEKLLRLPGRGAVAVVASSWRNVPPFSLAENIMKGLSTSSTTRLGDAFVAAMRQVGATDSLHTYNLLGDPTMPYTPPPATVATHEAAPAATEAAPVRP